MDDDRLRRAAELLKEACILFEEAGQMVVAARLGDIIDGLTEQSRDARRHALGRES